MCDHHRRDDIIRDRVGVIAARLWQVILVSRGSDDFRGCIVVPLRESCLVYVLVFHVYFERVLVVPVNLGVGLASITALEFGRG